MLRVLLFLLLIHLLRISCFIYHVCQLLRPNVLQRGGEPCEAATSGFYLLPPVSLRNKMKNHYIFYLKYNRSLHYEAAKQEGTCICKKGWMKQGKRWCTLLLCSVLGLRITETHRGARCCEVSSEHGKRIQWSCEEEHRRCGGSDEESLRSSHSALLASRALCDVNYLRKNKSIECLFRSA